MIIFLSLELVDGGMADTEEDSSTSYISRPECVGSFSIFWNREPRGTVPTNQPWTQDWLVIIRKLSDD